MNVLVVGFGSIGRRHAQTLAGMDEIGTVFVLTSQKPEEIHGGKVSFIKPPDLSHATLSEYLGGRNVTAALVTNETSKHIQTSLALARAGLHLFIEKPLSHSVSGASDLREIVRKNRLKVLVGYNLRFLRAINSLKDLLNERAIGDPYFVRIEVGYSLPLWRPERDYRTQYSASSAKGGGVALDLSHELDYMRYLFGQPQSWKVVRTKVSSLEIDTDDVFEGIYQYKSGLICSVHMDYLQPQKRRHIRIVGSRGVVECDLQGKFLKVAAEGCEEVNNEDEALFDVPATYLEEMRHFIATVQGLETPLVTLEDGMQVLQLLEDAGV
jgi:predicted dehydrogenase